MANQKQSILVQSQLPEFITQDHPTFLAFVEAYYEWLEIAKKSDSDVSLDRLHEVIGNPSNIINTALDNRDIDDTLEQFVDFFRREVIPISLDNAQVSQRELIKHIKQLYLSKGSPKSYELLFRILFNDSIDIYFPIDFVMEASEGTFTNVHTIRITIDQNAAEIAEFDFGSAILNRTSDLPTDSDVIIQAITVRPASGSTSIYEFIIDPTFVENSPYIPLTSVTITQFDELKTLTGEVVSRVASVTPGTGGSGFRTGDRIRLLNDSDVASAVIEVGSVRSGAVDRLIITNAGRNYAIGDILYFTAQNTVGGTGSGGSIQVTAVNPNGVITEIDNQAIVGANIFNPVTITVATGGSGYTELPSIVSSSPTGILLSATTASNTIGSINTYKIIDSGSFYTNVTIENSTVITIPDADVGVGTAIQFQVLTPGTFDSDGDPITSAFWTSLPYGGRIDSKSSAGRQYTIIPVDNVNGVTPDSDLPLPLLGIKESDIIVDTVYRIVSVVPSSGNIVTIYSSPIVDFEFDSGVSVQTAGSATTDKAYQSEDGFLNSASGGILRDNLLFHEYSYVIETEQAIINWRDIVKTLLHPAGTILFGEFNIVNEPPTSFLSVAEAFDVQSEFNETAKLSKHAWPNRVIDEQAALDGSTFSSGDLIAERDETNIGHDEEHFNVGTYQARYLNEEGYIGNITNLDSDTGIYTIRDNFRNKDIDIDRNVLYNTKVYVDSRDSDDLYYWRSEYTEHSEDLNDTDVTLTTYDGLVLGDEDTKFPYGNTPVRYRLSDSDTFKTTIFAPYESDDSDLNPEYSRYADSDGVRDADSDRTSFNPDADFEAIRGTITFDTDFGHFSETYSDAITADTIDHAANPLTDEQGEAILADNFPTQISLADTAQQGDGFWDYEPKIITQYGGFGNKAFDKTVTYAAGDRVVFQGLKYELMISATLGVAPNIGTDWSPVSPYTNKVIATFITTESYVINDEVRDAGIFYRAIRSAPGVLPGGGWVVIDIFSADNIAEFDSTISYESDDLVAWLGNAYNAADAIEPISDSESDVYFRDVEWLINNTIEVDTFRRTTTTRRTDEQDKPSEGKSYYTRYDSDVGGKKDNWYADYDENDYQTSQIVFDPINEGHYEVLSVENKEQIKWLRFDDDKGTYSSIEYPIERITIFTESDDNRDSEMVDVQTVITGPFRGHELREEYEKELRLALRMDGTFTYTADGINYIDTDAWERKWNTYTNRTDTLGWGEYGIFFAEYQNAEGYEKKNTELDYTLEKSPYRGVVTDYNRTVKTPGVIQIEDIDGNVIKVGK